MTLYTHDTNPQDTPEPFHKARSAKKKARAKAKGKIVKKVPKKPETVAVITTDTDTLTLNQIKFCKTYLEPETYGNGTQSYLKVYGCEYDTAKVEASKSLTNPNIQRYIHNLLEENGFNDNTADKAHLYCMLQLADLPSKMRAVEQYNKLKKRTDDSPKTEVILVVDELKLAKIREIQKRITKSE